VWVRGAAKVMPPLLFRAVHPGENREAAFLLKMEVEMMKMRVIRCAALVWALGLFLAVPAFADDSEASRRTLKGLPGVCVIVEELQPNLLKYEKYTKQFGLDKDSIQRDVEQKLTAAGIQVLLYEEWQKTSGRPVFYVNVNTHESEKYWFSYDIKVGLRQVAILEANPGVKTLAETWSLNVTGMTNIGNLKQIQQDLDRLLNKFVQAWAGTN
jgi:hypothetical protein